MKVSHWSHLCWKYHQICFEKTLNLNHIEQSCLYCSDSECVVAWNKLIQTQRVFAIRIWKSLVSWSIWQDFRNVFVFIFAQTDDAVRRLYSFMPCNLHGFCWRYIIVTELLRQVLPSTMVWKFLILKEFLHLSAFTSLLWIFCSPRSVAVWTIC